MWPTLIIQMTGFNKHVKISFACRVACFQSHFAMFIVKFSPNYGLQIQEKNMLKNNHISWKQAGLFYNDTKKEQSS